MKKIVLLFLVALIAMATVSAGGAGDNSSRDENAKHIVLLVKNTNSDFFVSMGVAAKARAESFGWTMDVLAPIQADNNEEQIQLLEQSLINPPDAYIIVPADSAGITPAIEEINKEGIPVLNLNTRFTDKSLDVITFYAIDNFGTGYAVAKAGAELIGGKGNVIMLDGTTGSQVSIDRNAGGNAAFAEYPGIKIIDTQTANFARAEALTVTQNLLQKHADIDLIWTSAGEMALGAAEAISQAGRKDEIQIVTQNAFKEMIEAVLDGRVAKTFDDAAWLQGQTAVDYVKEYFDGKTLDKEIIVPAIEVSDANMDEYKEMYDLN